MRYEGDAAGLVPANTGSQVVVALAPDFLRLLHPGGLRAASGFERREMDRVPAGPPPVMEARGPAAPPHFAWLLRATD
jgi:hypothetical protein